MVKKITLAVAMVALLAAPAFAAVQNVKVSGDLKTTSVIRTNFAPGFTLSSTTAIRDSQNVILSQVGVNIEADLTDNVSAFIRLGNERLWGTGTSSLTFNENNLVLDTAYVTMKEMLYAPLTVTIGRQPLVYGNAFLIGDGSRANEIAEVADLTGGKNFDAVKAVLDYDPLVVDIFAAKVDENFNRGLNDNDDANLYGINANWQLGGEMNVVLESYLFAQMDRTNITPTDAKTKKLYVPGMRVSVNPYEGLNVQLEGAYQTGNGKANEKISAYGLQGMANFALPVLKDMTPVVSASYTYLSGDEDKNLKITEFQPMYEDQNGGRIFDAINGTNTNVKIASLAAELSPVQDVTAKLSWYNLNKARGVAGTSSKKMGNEFDLDVTYAYTEDVKFGMSAGIFYAGKHYDTSTHKQDNATQVLTSVAVLF